MSNGVYVDKSTGEQVKILKEDTTFYVLDNSVRIKKDIFEKKYEKKAEVDPGSFFSAPVNADPLVAMAEQLKNMDTSKIKDNPESGARIKYIEKPVVLSDNSLPEGAKLRQPQVEEEIPLTAAEKKAMLDEWRRTQPGAQIPEVQNRNWDEEDEKLLNGDKPIEQKKIKQEPKVDPIQMMFKMFKSNYPVKIDLQIEENIPNPTFIGMVQENVEADAIEYYAGVISDKLLKNPSELKNKVYEQLKKIINSELGIEETEEEKQEKKDKE